MDKLTNFILTNSTKIFVFAILFGLNTNYTFGQNIGINTEDPAVSLDIEGGIRVRSQYVLVDDNFVEIPINSSHIVIQGTPTAEFEIVLTNFYDGMRLIIYNSTLYTGSIFQSIHIPSFTIIEMVFSDGQWRPLQSANAWTINGNSGTNGLFNFIGTLDDVDFNIRTNNNPRMTVKSKGKIGMGTSLPTARLEIANNGKADLKLNCSSFTDTTQIVFSNKIGDMYGTDFILASNKENGLRISSNSDLASNTRPLIMEFKPGGKIGVATATPEGKFQINHTASINSPSLTIFDTSAVNSGGGIIQFRNTAGINKFNMKASIGLNPDGSDSYLDFSNSIDQLVRIKANGNVGIGDDDPLHSLSVHGSSSKIMSLQNITPLDLGTNTTLAFETGNYRTAYISTYGENTSQARLGFSTGTSFIGGLFFIQERMSIANNGNVGINISNPTDRFEVNGNASIVGTNTFEFGKGVAGKELNAGKVGYNGFGQNALTFVGAGTTSLNRKVYFYAEGGTTFNGDVTVTNDVNINSDATINGNIGVGTTIVPSGYRVAVDGKIIAEELRIQNSTAWPDYVFEKDYSLMPLSEIEKSVKAHKHLPDVPSAEEVKADGVAVGDMQKILLKKIEELTLYIIEQEKRIQALESNIYK